MTQKQKPIVDPELKKMMKQLDEYRTKMRILRKEIKNYKSKIKPSIPDFIIRFD